MARAPTLDRPRSVACPHAVAGELRPSGPHRERARERPAQGRPGGRVLRRDPHHVRQRRRRRGRASSRTTCSRPATLDKIARVTAGPRRSAGGREGPVADQRGRRGGGRRHAAEAAAAHPAHRRGRRGPAREAHQRSRSTAKNLVADGLPRHGDQRRLRADVRRRLRATWTSTSASRAILAAEEGPRHRFLFTGRRRT